VSLSTLDWVIVVVYLLGTLGLGLVFTRRAGRSTDEYFLSGRNLPWWLAGSSMVATSFSSDTPLFVTGLVRSGGISANWVWWSLVIGGMFSVFFLSRLWRRAQVMTDVELTEMRYSGRPAAVLRGLRAAYLAIPVHSISLAWVILSMIKIMDVLFGPAAMAALVGSIAIMTLYSAMSGYWGVVVNDLVQLVIAMGGTVLLAVLAVWHFGGLENLRVQALACSKLNERLLEFFPRFEGGNPLELSFWTSPFMGFLIFVSIQWWAYKNSDGGGIIVQRVASCKNEKQALLATLWFNIAHYAIRPWPWILVAMASVVILPDLADGEAAYPEMIRRFAPPGIMGLMFATFLAAFMSTVSSYLNLSSAYLVNDVYRRFFAPNRSERHYVWVSRGASCAFMLMGAGIAAVSDSIANLFTFLLAFTAGVGVIYLLRWFWWRINAWSEISAMLASSLVSCLLYAFKEQLGGLTQPLILVLTTGISTAVALIVTLATGPVERGKLEAFYRKVRPPGRWGPVARSAGVAPASGAGRLIVNWIGGTVMVLGAMFAIGKALLGEYLAFWAWAAIALAGGWIVWRAIAKLDKENLPAEDEILDGSVQNLSHFC